MMSALSIVPVLDLIKQLSSAPPEQEVPAPTNQPGVGGSASQHKADQAEKYLKYIEEKLQAPPYGADSHARKTLVSVARSAVNAARTSYAKGNSQDGDAFISFATTVADMALSLTPIVGWGKDLYETVSGFSLLDNHKLSSFERTMAAVGVLTGGLAGAVGVLAKSAMAAGIITDAARLAGRGEGISEATKDALKIFDSAKKSGALTGEEVIEIAQASGKGSNNLWKSSRVNPESGKHAVDYEHIFSKAHLDGGIMELGNNRAEIVDNASKALQKADDLDRLVTGSNDILLKMNGYDATISSIF